jgi:hypothetical protein
MEGDAGIPLLPVLRGVTGNTGLGSRFDVDSRGFLAVAPPDGRAVEGDIPIWASFVLEGTLEGFLGEIFSVSCPVLESFCSLVVEGPEPTLCFNLLYSPVTPLVTTSFGPDLTLLLS